MTIRPIAAALITTLGLGGCGPSTPSDNSARATVTVRSEGQDRLHKLSELNRAIGLKRAIYDAGSVCQRVVETRFVGPYKNMDMWAARCADKQDWALFVGPDDSVQVRLCKDTEAVGLPSCQLEVSGAAAKPAPAAAPAAG